MTRVLLIGATGTIGRAIADALRDTHEVIEASRRSGVRVDLADGASIRRMYQEVGRLDAVVSAAGEARYAPLTELSDEDFQFSVASKLMGQVNLVRFGVDMVEDNGSFTLTGGVLASHPSPGSAAISLVNAGLEGFVRAAALEMPRGIRINVVSPGWVSETLGAMGRDPAAGTAAADVARAYVESVDGRRTGAVIEPVSGTRSR